jgi:hypothetical protein
MLKIVYGLDNRPPYNPEPRTEELLQIGGEDPVIVGQPVPLLTIEKPEVEKPLLVEPEPPSEPAQAEARGEDLPAAEQTIDFAQ